jgi:hypothetical protein
MARQNLLRHRARNLRLMRSLRILRCQKTTEHYRIRMVAETTFGIELLIGPVNEFGSPGLSRKRNSRSLDFEAVIKKVFTYLGVKYESTGDAPYENVRRSSDRHTRATRRHDASTTWAWS